MHYLKRYQIAFYTLILLLMVFSGCSLMQNNNEKAEKDYKAGLTSLEQGKTEEAEIHFKNAIQKNPFLAGAHYRLGLIYVRTNQLFLAVRELNEAIKQDPELYEAKEAMILLSYQNQAYEHAIPLCEDFIKNRGNNLRIFLIWGDSLLKIKKHAEAVQVLEKAVQEYPDDPEARIHLAKALLLQKRQDEGFKMMETAASLAPNDLAIQISMADFYETINEYDSAERVFSRNCQFFPKNPLSYIALAQYYVRRNRLNEAESTVAQALASDIKDSRFYQILAQVQHKRANYEEALRNLRLAVSASDESTYSQNLMLLADYYFYQKNYPMARDSYQKILEKSPELTMVKMRLVELLLAEGQFEQAKTEVDKILTKRPDLAEGHLLRGVLLLRNGKTSEAREAFFTARSLSPESAEPHYYYGLTFLSDRDYKISLSEILSALARNPNSWLARLALAYIYFNTGKSDLALEELDRILAEDPDNPRARWLRGAVYQRERDYQRAAVDYSHVIEKSPDVPDLSAYRLRLADIYQAQGKQKEALEQLALVMNSGEDNLRALERIIRIYLITGDYEKALNLTDEHLMKNPNSLDIGLLKAEVLIRHESFEVSQKFVSDLMQRHPHSDRAAFLMGNLNLKHGKPEAAIETFQKVNLINPQNAEGYIELARTFQLVGNFEKAVETYERFLKTNGFVPSIGNDLAYLYAEMNQNLDRALELAKQAREALPQSPEAADTLGWVHLKRKSLVIATNYLQQALRAQPNNPAFNYHVGIAQFEENDFSKAHKTLQNAVKLGLGKAEAASAAAMIEKIEFTQEMIKTAEAHENSGEFEKAITDYEELIRKGPFLIPVVNRLARLYTNTKKNLDRAMELTEKVRARQPNNAEAADTMGWVYLKRGSHLMAKKYFHEAITLAPNMPIFHYHLGAALALQKDFSEAKKELETAISLGLGGEELEEARRMLREDLGVVTQ